MKNLEIVSKKQLKYMVITVIGSSILYFGSSSLSKQDSWLSTLIAISFAIPLFLLYSFIMKRNNKSNLFDICLNYFGKVFGRIVIILFSLYFLMLAFIAINNTITFLKAVIYEKTPRIVFALLFIIVNIYILKKGIEVLGRMITTFVPVILFLMFISTIFIFPEMDINNLKPFFSADKKDFLKNTLQLFLFGFGDIILLLTITYNSKENSPIKPLIYGLLIGGILILVIGVTNITILGLNTVNDLVYPFYYSYSIINIGNFITRIEIIISISAVIFILIESTLATYACTKGISKLFKIKKDMKIVVVVSVILLGLILFLFNNNEDFERFKNNTVLFTVIIQIVLPLLIGIFALFKKRNPKTDDIEIDSYDI